MTVSPVPYGTMIKIDTTLVSLIFIYFYRGHLQAVLCSGAVVLEEQNQGTLWLIILPDRLGGSHTMYWGQTPHLAHVRHVFYSFESDVPNPLSVNTTFWRCRRQVGPHFAVLREIWIRVSTGTASIISLVIKKYILEYCPFICLD